MLNQLKSACVIAAVACFVPFAEAQTLPPVEAFGNLPEVTDMNLSPDGKHFAVIRPYKGRPAAVIYETSPSPGSKPAAIVNNEAIIAAVRWASNDRLIVIGKQGFAAEFDKLRTWARAYAVDIAATKMITLLRRSPTFNYIVNTANIVDLDLDDPDHILMGMIDFTNEYTSAIDTKLQRNTATRLDLLKVDVHTGDGELLVAGNADTLAWYTDGHGKPLVRIDRTEAPLKDHLFLLQDGRWNEIGTFDAEADKGAHLVGFSADGNALVFDRQNDASFSGLVQRQLSDGKETPLFYAPGYDAGAILDEWTGRVIGGSYIGTKIEYRYFDPGRQALQSTIERAFPGRSVDIVSWDAVGSNAVVTVDGPRYPRKYFLLDRATHQMRLLSDSYPLLKPADLGEMQSYDYKARDGLAIPAYLTLPPGKTPKNLPVVVMPHGGPDWRDYPSFDWWAQFLANRGYAVLQPNFRGSDGYGHKFTEAGQHQWGLKIQDDITDGVLKLIADGIADPKRICIVGASFGGYVALAGATFTPDLYACAVSWAGVSDLPMALHQSIESPWLLSFWKSRIGSDDMPTLIATSPSRHADRIKCPVLLMHGEADTTVRIEQSEAMYKALQKAGKNVTFIRFTGGEDHYMNVTETRIRMLTEVEKFLRANIGN